MSDERRTSPVRNGGKPSPSDLKDRTREFALAVIRLYAALPKTPVEQTIGKQLLRSSTSVGAQYREGHRARSTAEFISKLEGALQELEETRYWLELLESAARPAPSSLPILIGETDELIAIFVTSVKTAKARLRP